MTDGQRVLDFIETVSGLVSAAAENPENRREVSAREASRLLCEERHIVVVGRADNRAHCRLLELLVGTYRTELAFTFVDVACAPSLPQPVVSLVYNNTPQWVPETERTYPTLFTAFLSDTPAHREHLDAAVLMTAVQAGFMPEPAKIQDSAERGPILLLRGSEFPGKRDGDVRHPKETSSWTGRRSKRQLISPGEAKMSELIDLNHEREKIAGRELSLAYAAASELAELCYPRWR